MVEHDIEATAGRRQNRERLLADAASSEAQTAEPEVRGPQIYYWGIQTVPPSPRILIGALRFLFSSMYIGWQLAYCCVILFELRYVVSFESSSAARLEETTTLSHVLHTARVAAGSRLDVAMYIKEDTLDRVWPCRMPTASS